MKTTIKRIMQFLVAFALVFTLFGCDTTGKITVEFETNGGTAVQTMEIELAKIAEFKLPAEPTKDGCTFAGWFTDSELNTAFTALVNKEGKITLYAKWNAEPVTEVRVNYDVDGAAAMDSQIIKAENASSYVPATPVKAGKIFAGWYTDKEFTTPFDELALTSKEVTLYAKWEDSLGYEFNYSIDIKQNSNLEVDKEVVPGPISNGKLNVNLKINNVNSKDYLDYEAILNAKVVFNAEGFSEAPVKGDYEVTLYFKAGKIYVTIPGEIMDSPMPMSVAIDVMQLVAAVKDKLEVVMEKLAENEQFSEFTEMTPEEIQAKIMEFLAPYLAKLTEIGINEEFLNDVKAVFATLMPVTKTEGTVITSEVTNEQVNKFFNAINTFLDKNLGKIYDLSMYIQSLTETEPENEDYEFDGMVFLADGTGWKDTNDVFHSYSEDTEFSYGYIDGVNRYWPSYADGCYLDTKDNWKVVYGEGYSGCFVIEGQDGYYDSEAAYHPFSEDFETLMYGYLWNETVYKPYYSENMYFIATGAKLTEEDVKAIELADAKKGYGPFFLMINSMYKLNKCVFKQTNDENGNPVSFAFDFDLSISIPTEKGINNASAIVDMDLVISGNPVMEFPDLTTFTDFTPTLIQAINSIEIPEIPDFELPIASK